MTDITRRGFIKRLAACAVAVPFLPKLIEAKPEVIVGVDKALEGSDNTSVWMVNWGEDSLHQIGQEVSDSMFYGDSKSEPETFAGLRGRYA